MTRRHLRFERLEQRLLLAGNVKVAVSRGNLTLTGDSLPAGNQIEIAYENNAYVVTGLKGTTVEGQPAKIITEVNKNITVDLKSGANEVEIRGDAEGGSPFLVLGGLTVRSGSGGAVIIISDAEVRGNVSITTGSGSDQVLVTGLTAPPVRNGRVSINTGYGNDSVGVVDSTIQRNLSISTGNGNDLVGLVRVDTSGSIAVNAGEGAEDLIGIAGVTSGNMTLDGGNAGRRSRPGDSTIGVTASVITGNLTIRTGIGDDTVAIGDHPDLGGQIEQVLEELGLDLEVPTGEVKVTNTLNIATNNGDDEVWLQNVKDVARLNVNTGNGDDEVWLENLTNVARLTVNTGNGDDRVGVVDSIFQGDINIATGSDNDQVGLFNVIALHRTITVNTGNGNNGLDVIGLAGVEARNAVLNGGNTGTRGPWGASSIGVTKSTFTGDLTIRQGHAADWVVIGDHNELEDAFDELKDPFGNPIQVEMGTVSVNGTVRITTNSDGLTNQFGDGVLIGDLTALVLRVDTGLGNDRVTIRSNVVVTQEFDLRLGGQNDTLRIEVAPDVFLASLPAKRLIDGGAGTDTLQSNPVFPQPLDGTVFKGWERVVLLPV
jgi:hypothetical protein